MPSFRIIRNLVIKAIVWNIWLARNDCIFNVIVVPVHILCIKINRMRLSRFSATSDGLKEKIEDSMSIVRQSLEFSSSHAEETAKVPSFEEIFYHDAG